MFSELPPSVPTALLQWGWGLHRGPCSIPNFKQVASQHSVQTDFTENSVDANENFPIGHAGCIEKTKDDYVPFDTLFMVSSIDELGRRQLTDTIRRSLIMNACEITVACTKTAAFSGRGVSRQKHVTLSKNKFNPSSHKSLQMFVLCQKTHAPRVRNPLYESIRARRPRRYHTRSTDGKSRPLVPVFVYEFTALDRVLLHKENTLTDQPINTENSGHGRTRT
uniref:ORF58 n=1 Tax=Human herpesvirus 3 TaxID=10335 RepID=A0A1B1JGF1_HHV3|nr:ORF58 [Human alphaherpesvirus 3]QWE79561.1 ORF58 [Human alphaherpesvirus 3]